VQDVRACARNHEAMMADPGKSSFEPISVKSHQDFLKNMKEIVTRLNNNPDVARLVLVNPIYALQDLGVSLSKDMQDHVFQTFNSPPAKQNRLSELEQELRTELDKLPDKPAIPTTPQQRATLVFKDLGVARKKDNSGDSLEREQLLAYARSHPLIPKLIEYERVSRSGLTFFPRTMYDSYKRGEAKQKWLNSIHFSS
jgi:hypothetical protein